MESSDRPVQSGKIELAQFMFSLLGLTVGVVVFTYTTFATKSDLEAKDRSDEKSINYIRDDMKEIKQDVKELLKKSKR